MTDSNLISSSLRNRPSFAVVHSYIPFFIAAKIAPIFVTLAYVSHPVVPLIRTTALSRVAVERKEVKKRSFFHIFASHPVVFPLVCFQLTFFFLSFVCLQWFGCSLTTYTWPHYLIQIYRRILTVAHAVLSIFYMYPHVNVNTFPNALFFIQATSTIANSNQT